MYKIILLLQLSILILFSSSQAQVAEKPMSTFININKMVMWVRADGYSAHNPYSNSNQALQWGVLYPRGIPAGLVWVDAFVWGGMVADGQEPIIRVGGTNLQGSGLQPGAFTAMGQAEDPTDPQVNHIWRYRPDWQTADLTDEARDLLSFRPGADSTNFQFPPEELQRLADSLRTAYAQDLASWPWQKGAPFYDDNQNGVMDEGEEPGLLNASQVVWFVANDLDTQKTEALYGSPPIGMELQVTLWAYRDDPDLENSIFRRNRMIYRGTDATPVGAHIDSMAIGLYSEVDIGSFSDDFAGTDTTLQMVYGYNSTTQDFAYQQFESAPPALGYALLYGPIIASANQNDVAMFDFEMRKGLRNLPMTGSWIDRAGDTDSQPSAGIYDGTLQYYNVLNGFRPRPITPPTPFFDPLTADPTRFTITGDPNSNTGWVDDSPGNRQITMTSGNFNMALGDTQEVVITMTAGLGADRLASVEAMKFFARKAREFAEFNFVTDVKETGDDISPETFALYQNYPNPFNPTTTIRYDLPQNSRVTVSIFNILGQEIARLVDRVQPAGKHTVQWDATQSGVPVSSGVYFYKIKTKGFEQIHKMLLVK